MHAVKEWWVSNAHVKDACTVHQRIYIYITCSEYVFTSFSHRRHLLWSIVNLFHHTHRYLTRNQHVKHKSMYTNLVLCQNIFLQSMENVNNSWCTISFGIGLAGTPCKVQNWAKEELRNLKSGKLWGFVEGWDLCTADSTRLFLARHACVAALQLFSTLERRLVSGARVSVASADVSPSLTLDFWPSTILKLPEAGSGWNWGQRWAPGFTSDHFTAAGTLHFTWVPSTKKLPE